MKGLCLVYSNFIRNYLYNGSVRREVAVFPITLVRTYKWYEKYATGMQGKFDISSFFMCNSLYNRTGMKSMRFTPPGHCGAINGITCLRRILSGSVWFAHILCEFQYIIIRLCGLTILHTQDPAEQ